MIKKLSIFSYFLLSTGLVILLSACDQFLQDPGKMLYRPEVLKIEDLSGKGYDKLPLPGGGSSQKETLLPLNNHGKQVQWGELSDSFKDLVPFDSQEIPYLGGDNCLNSVFFDLTGVPFSGQKPQAYQKDILYKSLLVLSEGADHYFFLSDRLFLVEHTYPFFLGEGKSIVGKETLTGGADPAIDRFYRTRLEFYRTAFQNKSASFKILCDYSPMEFGRVKENILLHVFEDKETFHFLADKQVHYLTRKDSVQRFISEFSFSKDFLREGLQFRKK